MGAKEKAEQKRKIGKMKKKVIKGGG